MNDKTIIIRALNKHFDFHLKMAFCVTLMRSQKEGSMSDWRTTLPRSLNFDEPYCVALKEISFTDSIFTLKKDHFFIMFGRSTIKKLIPAGRYPNVRSILNTMNNKLRYISWEGIRPNLVIEGGNVVCKTGSNGSIYLEPSLAAFLGYDNPEITERQLKIPSTSDTPLWTDHTSVEEIEDNYRDKYNSIRSIIVYLDITDYTIVGDSLSNLLRFVEVPSDSNFGHQVVAHYTSPEWVKLSCNSFSSIQTMIKDVSGEDVEFKFGSVILSLLFRPLNISIMSMLSLQRDEFRVILPSNTTNGGRALHHQNTLTHWKTLLPHPLHLEGEWEVALTEISYTYSWNNINYDVDCVFVDDEGNEIADRFRILDKGMYTSALRLVVEMNEKMKRIQEVVPYIATSPSFVVNKFTQLIKISPGSTTGNKLIYPITFPVGELKSRKRRATINTAPILQLRGVRTFVPEPSTSFTAMVDNKITYEVDKLSAYKRLISSTIKDEQSFYDVSSDIRTLFVHSNIIQHSVIGSKFGQVLRTVKVPSKAQPNDQITIEDSDPIFHQLISNHISQIDIKLKDDEGDYIPFQDGGESRVTLLFRRRLQ